MIEYAEIYLITMNDFSGTYLFFDVHRRYYNNQNNKKKFQIYDISTNSEKIT